MKQDAALQSGLDYVFSFFERGHRGQAGKFDRDVRRPEIFAGIARSHSLLPNPATTIVVTGSKGKGTCARLLAAYLQGQGKRCGLVLTPEERHHLDRIRINGDAISAPDFLCLLHDLKPSLDQSAASGGAMFYHPPTSIFLLVALKHFRDQGVDFVVIEGGRGARFDEIGQIAAKVGVVTSILPEHLAKLGPDLGDICADKFSLLESCATVVCSQQAWAQAGAHGTALDAARTVVAASGEVVPGRPAWLATADGLARTALAQFGLQAGAFPHDASVLASCQIITDATSSLLRPGQAVFLDGAVTADCLDFSYMQSRACAPRAVLIGMSADKDMDAVVQALHARDLGPHYFFEPLSATGHVAAAAGVSSYAGCFDTEKGLDSSSKECLLRLIARHERIYVIGVQVFLRSVRNALSEQ